MNILKVALILTTSIVVSGAPVSPSNDKRVDYQIDKLTGPGLNNIFATSTTRAQIKTSYDAFRTAFNTRMTSSLAELDLEQNGINEIRLVKPFDEYNFSDVFGKGGAIIESIKEDWKLRKRTMEMFDRLSMEKNEVVSQLSNLEGERNEAVKGLNRSCDVNQSLTTCFSRNLPGLQRQVAPIKTWAYAQEMFGNPAGVTSEWVKPDWKPALDTFPNASTRFAIAPVSEDLSLEALKKRNNDNLTLAMRSIKVNLDNLKKLVPSSNTELANDFALRDSVISAMLVPLNHDEQSITVDEEVIKHRLKGLERVAEGIARAKQNDVIFESYMEAEYKEAVKAWLMAKQMFSESGRSDATVVHFATIQVPYTIHSPNRAEVAVDNSAHAVQPSTPVSAHPSGSEHATSPAHAPVASSHVATVHKPETKPRSNSNASTASTASTASGTSAHINLPETKKRTGFLSFLRF